MYGFSFTWNHHHTYYKMAPIGSSVLSPHEIPAYSASLQIHENLGQQLFLLYMYAWSGKMHSVQKFEEIVQLCIS